MISLMQRQLNRTGDERGFTLIEVIVAVVIFSILAAIAIPIYMSQQKSAMESQIQTALTNASIILKQERTGANGVYPSALPADVIIPNDISVEYTTSTNRDFYCLEMSYQGEAVEAWFLNGDDAGDTNITQTACTYSGTGVSSTVLSGDVTSTNEPLLSWNEVPGAESYTVYNTTSGEVFQVTGGATTWTGVPMETLNKFAVTAKANGEESERSNVVSLSPASVKPTATPILTLNNVSESSAQRSGTLNWNPVQWADEYIIMDADANTEMWRGSKYSLEVSAGIGQTLRVYLIAANDVGRSPNSNVIELEGPLPTSPTLNLTSTQSSAGVRATLTWEDVPGAVAYKLYKNGTMIASNAKSGLDDLTDWNNSLITYYIVPVTETNKDGDKSNNVSVDTTMPVPSTPAWEDDSYSSSDVWTVKWEESTWALSYQIQYRSNGGSWVTVDRGTNLSYGRTMSAGQKLEMRVRATNYSGSSAWSDILEYVSGVGKPKLNGSVSYANYNSSGNGYNQVTVPVICPDGGSIVSQRRQDRTGSWSDWSGESTATQAQHTTGIYGYRTSVQWRFWCKSNGVYSNRLDVNTKMPAKPVPAPSEGKFRQTSPTWVGGSNMVRQYLYSKHSTGCPSGTSLAWRLMLSGDNDFDNNSWGSWVIDTSSRTEAGAHTSYSNWKNYNYVRAQSRCVSDYNTSVTSSAVWVRDSGGNGWITETLKFEIPKPTGVWLKITSYRTAGWGSSCVGGTWKQYYYTKEDPNGYYSGATTKTSYSQTSKPWGSSTHKLTTDCNSNYNDADGPNVVVTGSY